MVTGRAPKGSRWPQTLHAPCLSVLVHTAGDTPAEETASETSVDVESCWVPGGGEFNQSSKELGAKRGRQPQSPADEQTAQTQRRGEGLGPPAGAPSEAKPHGALLSQRPSMSHGEAKGVLLCRRSVEETCVPGRPTLFSRQPKKGHQRGGSTQTRSLPQPREPGEGPSCLFRPTGPGLCPIAWPLGSAVLRPLLRACVSSSVHTDPLDSERPGVTPASSSVHYTCRDPSSKQSPVLRTQVALTRGHWPLQQVLRLAVRPVLPRPLGRTGGRAHGVSRLDSLVRVRASPAGLNRPVCAGPPTACHPVGATCLLYRGNERQAPLTPQRAPSQQDGSQTAHRGAPGRGNPLGHRVLNLLRESQHCSGPRRPQVGRGRAQAPAASSAWALSDK